MDKLITVSELIALGLAQTEAAVLISELDPIIAHTDSSAARWSAIAKQVLTDKHYPFAIHHFIFSRLYPDWPAHPDSAPAWLPDNETLASANLVSLLKETGSRDIPALHQWTTDHYRKFWEWTIKKLAIPFKKSPDQIVDLSGGTNKPSWLPGAKLNIADSCFLATADATAILYPDENGHIHKVSYGELNKLSNQIANSLIAAGFKAGDAMGICMPMNLHAVAIYLGIIKMGGVVVSIADSFSSHEIAVRLKIANAKAIFTQDVAKWAGKMIAIYNKVLDATTCKIILLPYSADTLKTTAENTQHWHAFLKSDTNFTSHACDPMMACNILFSSGTTADPKAIVWNHTTPIKAASDAFYHQNIKPGDVLAWPTNLGWMMGPWLIFAALMNRATVALFPDAPKDDAFGKFIQDANVTMLGVVPTLVATWRQSQCMEALDWRKIKVFSSTGECSNPEDMLYLMSLADYKPIIEYCGGTEIGGSYISSTVMQPNYPSLFTTPAMGMNITLLDENGEISDHGEVAIIPPSVGLSTELLNADHEKIYFNDMPVWKNGIVLRRHGDQLKRFANGTYSILGRSDDAMNLGGIKVSAAEIERVLSTIDEIFETAAIAVTPPNNGPSKLVVYAVAIRTLDKAVMMKTMQGKINRELNPLFKIADLQFVTELPKTASNKIMRRRLRSGYLLIKQ